jgi:hypothetical protein
MKTHKEHRTQRRIYPEAVQMQLDGHSASSVAHKIFWKRKRRYGAKRIAAHGSLYVRAVSVRIGRAYRSATREPGEPPFGVALSLEFCWARGILEAPPQREKSLHFNKLTLTGLRIASRALGRESGSSAGSLFERLSAADERGDPRPVRH